MEEQKDIPLLDEEQNKRLKHFAKMAAENKSEWYLKFRGTSWSTDTDALVFIDSEGMDTAWMDGADYHLNKHLTEEEIQTLNKEGYIVKDKMIFAFSRFLLEKFITASLTVEFQSKEIKAHERAWKRLAVSIEKVSETIEANETRDENAPRISPTEGLDEGDLELGITKQDRDTPLLEG